jgi:dTDP-glucose 4,6-dehydratase
MDSVIVGDVRDEKFLSELAENNYDVLIHLVSLDHNHSNGMPSHVSSVNITPVWSLLDIFSKQGLKKFIYFSTDEVFGPAPKDINYKEWDRYNTTNPYSAAKAGGEELCLAYANTYKLPIIISHCMNAFGERQHPEKYIPSTINKILQGETVTIHSDPTCTKAGTRFYIHCRNISAATLFLLNNGQARDKYNIVGEKEVDNLILAETIAKIIRKPLIYQMVNFHGSRPGHDLRYGLDGSKMKEMGWVIPKDFESSLEKTIIWYLNNRKWLDW